MSVQQLEIKASCYLAALFLVVYFGAMLILLILPMVVWLKCLGILLGVADLIRIARLHVFRVSPKAIIKLWLTPEGGWLLQMRQGTEIQVKLLGDSFISAYLIVLNFKRLDKRRSISVILTRDNVTQDCFRQLSIYLRLGQEKSLGSH